MKFFHWSLKSVELADSAPGLDHHAILVAKCLFAKRCETGDIRLTPNSGHTIHHDSIYKTSAYLP